MINPEAKLVIVALITIFIRDSTSVAIVIDAVMGFAIEATAIVGFISVAVTVAKATAVVSFASMAIITNIVDVIVAVGPISMATIIIEATVAMDSIPKATAVEASAVVGSISKATIIIEANVAMGSIPKATAVEAIDAIVARDAIVANLGAALDADPKVDVANLVADLDADLDADPSVIVANLSADLGVIIVYLNAFTEITNATVIDSYIKATVVPISITTLKAALIY